ncbi:MAG: nucleotidyltransferase family protein [Bacteroidales bacterium]|nr:nucleotidyltransferase family protein [Bacteroidales bacterium]
MTEAIVLAGGFGTRLRHVVSDVPKPMAPIGGQPFLSFLLYHLSREGYTHVVIATGYMHQTIVDFFGNTFAGMTISYAHEQSPLGTGGAIVNALQCCMSDHVTVLNGDTLFNINHRQFIATADALPARITIVTRYVPDAGRYGAVVDGSRQQPIIAFCEKQTNVGKGYINGGIYRMHRSLLSHWSLGTPFSFEKEVLQPLAEPIFAYPDDAYFIDIGVPDDYARAQNELPLLAV